MKRTNFKALANYPITFNHYRNRTVLCNIIIRLVPANLHHFRKSFLDLTCPIEREREREGEKGT